MVIEGMRGQWDDLFTDQMSYTSVMTDKSILTLVSIQKYIKENCEEKYTRYREEKVLLEVKGNNYFGHPYRITGRIEKINYNIMMMLICKEDLGFALVDLMMIKEINPLQ